MLECKRSRRYDVGFIDPYIINEYTLKNHPKDVEEDLYRFLTEHNFVKEILFPYNFKWVFISCTHFIFAYSMSYICMYAYVNVRRFHWILLNIQVDNSLVEVHDSLSWDQEKWSDMKAMLRK